ncbi:hypothetical protein URH17368_0206 [Alicyclobacillus hesperidum URH17-3-68]|nr:hypothetical protein URH17368_0206 [Alicyclobacillus hesperidum URH17-3-68]
MRKPVDFGLRAPATAGNPEALAKASTRASPLLETMQT